MANFISGNSGTAKMAAMQEALASNPNIKVKIKIKVKPNGQVKSNANAKAAGKSGQASKEDS